MRAAWRGLQTGMWVALLAALLAAGGCERRADVQGAMSGGAGTERSERTTNTAQASARNDGQDSAQAATETPAGAQTRAPSRTVVEAIELRPTDFTLSATYIGHLLPRARVEMRAEIDGVAERVSFSEGQTLARGDPLVNISTEQLRVRRDQAKADLALAESNYERDRSLHAKRLIADAAMEQSANRRDLARYALRLAEIELAKSTVTAPIAGTVKTRGVERGEFLSKGQFIAEILDVSRVRARFNVPEREVRFLREGRTVDVLFDALPGERYSAVVRLVGLEADVQTRTFPVEVELDNAAGRLRPGMLARVSVALEQFRDQLLAPRYAVLERENGRVVYVARNGHAEERVIETGAASQGRVQVLRGLSPGELLIVTGQQRLTPGEPIEVRQVQR